MKTSGLIGIFAFLAAVACITVTCNDGNFTGGESEILITYTVTETGGNSGESNTTGINFVFSAPVNRLGLNAGDITLNGEAAEKIGETVFTGNNSRWTLSPIRVNFSGFTNVTITKEGVTKVPRYIAVYYIADPDDDDNEDD